MEIFKVKCTAYKSMEFIEININYNKTFFKIITKIYPILQGRARVELYDKTSTSFVLTKVKFVYLIKSFAYSFQLVKWFKRLLWHLSNTTFQKWKINGSELHVTDSEQSIGSNNRTNTDIEMQSDRNIKTRTKSEMPYQLYRRNANSFWADIPHHASRIRAKKAKVKFHTGFTKRTCAETMFGMCQNKRKIQKRNSKKSNVKQHLLTHSYNSLKLVRQITYLWLYKANNKSIYEMYYYWQTIRYFYFIVELGSNKVWLLAKQRKFGLNFSSDFVFW